MTDSVSFTPSDMARIKPHKVEPETPKNKGESSSSSGSHLRQYGISKKGTVEKCRAKPENRGKGRCKHGVHFKVDKKISPEEFAEVVEREVAKALSRNPRLNVGKRLRRKAEQLALENPGMYSIKSAVITREELVRQSRLVSDEISDDDWENIKTYSDIIDGIGEVDSNIEDRIDTIKQKVYERLTAEDTQPVRDYLGEDADLDEIARIIAKGGGAMTRPSANTDYASAYRLFLTRLDNDMNDKHKFVASVLFFGGKCCYCGCRMVSKTVAKKKKTPKNQATGEHLTPIHSDSEIVSSTRFGNMALACYACNNSRGNEDLVEWLANTDRVHKKDKPLVLARISKFRQFAFYSEYTPKQSSEIKEVIHKFKSFRESLYSREDLSLAEKRSLADERFMRDLGKLQLITRGLET